MGNLSNLEKEAQELNTLLTDAIRSDSIDLKYRAISTVENSNLFKEQHLLLFYMNENGPTVAKIKLAKNILPTWIVTLQDKVKGIKDSVGLNEESEKSSSIKINTAHSNSLLAHVKATIQSYVNSLTSREDEYSYGNVEYYGRFFGCSGYSKSEKTTAIENLYAAIESDGETPLSSKNIDILNQGTLGSDYLNPLLKHPEFGSKISDLISRDKPKQDFTR